MEEASWELQDWEILHHSEPGLTFPSDSSQTSSPKDPAFITPNYFAIDSPHNLVQHASLHSDNPTWVDPALGFLRKNSTEFWSDSNSDASGSHKTRDFDSKQDVGDGIGEKGLDSANFEAKQLLGLLDSTEIDKGKIGCFKEEDSYEFGLVGCGLGMEHTAKGEYGSFKAQELDELKQEIVDFGNFWSDSGGSALVQEKIQSVQGEGNTNTSFGEIGKGSESGDGVELEYAEFVRERGTGELGSEKSDHLGEDMIGGVEGEGHLGCAESSDKSESGSTVVEVQGGDGSECAEVVEGGRGEITHETVLASADMEKKPIIWWRLPFEMLKFCVFRVSPVWSVSVAAAVMGIVILGRRLHKMKKKSRSIPLKVTIDDKKVSQFMIRAARLNEAFSVVRRVPIVRPSLPASGVTPWPMMSLR